MEHAYTMGKTGSEEVQQNKGVENVFRWLLGGGFKRDASGVPPRVSPSEPAGVQYAVIETRMIQFDFDFRYYFKFGFLEN